MTASVAILISGKGTNMKALLDRKESGDLSCEIPFIASDTSKAEGLLLAQAMGIKTEILPYKEKGKEEAERVLDEMCRSHHVQWLVLAGFMRILSPWFVNRWEGKILNIHPALLPSFPGNRAIWDAWEYGVKVTGITIHLVDRGMDSGIILAQKAIVIKEEDTLDSLTTKIHETEHDLYWKTLKKAIEGRYSFDGRRAINDSY
jgi:phosphoribosylglycinamide formyltransferase-1